MKWSEKQIEAEQHIRKTVLRQELENKEKETQGNGKSVCLDVRKYI